MRKSSNMTHILPLAVILYGLVISMTFTVASENDVTSKEKLHSKAVLSKASISSSFRSGIGRRRTSFEGLTKEKDGDKSDEELPYDYDYEDQDDIYDYSHLKFELVELVEEKMASLKARLYEDYNSTMEKVATLEKQLEKNEENIHLLEMRLRVSTNPQIGDLVLLTHDWAQNRRQGILQFYTGTVWGFVCDDFFNQVSASVACSQLGFSGNFATVSFGRLEESSLMQDLLEGYNIVLDDVVCQGRETSLDSCQHSKIGEHDCQLEEVVLLGC